jgi:hypothetical protein
VRDVVFVVVTVGFFFASLGYLLACDLLQGKRR